MRVHGLLGCGCASVNEGKRALERPILQSPTRLQLELLDGLPQIPADDLSVPIDPVQGARHDVLLCRVDRPGEGFHPIRPRSRPRQRPKRCLHHFVGDPAKEKGISLGDAFDRVTMQLFVRGYFTMIGMIAAPVQCDVDGIPKGSPGAARVGRECISSAVGTAAAAAQSTASACAPADAAARAARSGATRTVEPGVTCAATSTPAACTTSTAIDGAAGAASTATSADDRAAGADCTSTAAAAKSARSTNAAATEAACTTCARAARAASARIANLTGPAGKRIRDNARARAITNLAGPTDGSLWRRIARARAVAGGAADPAARTAAKPASASI